MATAEELLLSFQKRQQAPKVQQAPQVQPEPVDEAGEMLQRFQQREAAEVALGPPAEDPSYWEQFKDVFTGELRETPETAGLPELVSSRGVTTGTFVGDLKTAAGLMLASNDEAKKDIIKENFGLKDEDFQTDEKGTTIITLPDGKRVVLNKPGFSFQDVQSVLGDLVAFYGPSKIAGLGQGLAKRFAIGAAATGATEAGLQKGVQALGSKQEVDPVTVGMATGLGGVAEVAGPLVRGQLAKRRAAKVGAEVEGMTEALGQVTQAERVTKKTGIPLTRPQKTGVLTDLERQSYVASLPGGSKKAAETLQAQNRAAWEAVTDVMNKLAPAEAVETAAGKTREAAAKAIRAKKQARTQAAKPYYDEAFADTSPVELPETMAKIKELKEGFTEGGDVWKILEMAENRIEPKIKVAAIGDAPATTVVKRPNLKQLNGTKKEFDSKINKFGTDSLGQEEKRALTEIKNTMRDEMAEVSPSYKQALETHAEFSPDVQRLEDSIIGKIAGLDDTQLKSVSSKLFDVQEAGANAASVVKARKIIEAQDPQVWRDITRLEFQKRLGKMRATADELGGTIENIPGQMNRALFGNVAQSKTLYAGLDKETAKNVRFLQEGLKRASGGRPGGSQTAIRGVIQKELKGGVGGAIRDFIGSPLKAAGDVGADYAFEQRTRALANVMFDPKWRPQLKKARASKKPYRIMKDILNRAVKDFGKPAAQALRPDRGD